VSADNEIIAQGCVFNSGKCIMEWTGSNPLLTIWESLEDLEAVSKIMKSKIVFI